MTRLIDANTFKQQLQIIEGFEIDRYGNIYTNVNALNIALERSAIDTEPHWIPCSERLPEDDRSKVVTLANGNAEVGYYSNGDWWCVGDKFTLENPTVIAWMPLPEPYEVNHE